MRGSGGQGGAVAMETRSWGRAETGAGPGGPGLWWWGLEWWRLRRERCVVKSVSVRSEEVKMGGDLDCSLARGGGGRAHHGCW